MHHLDSWIKRDQLDVTCFIISLFNAQRVSDVLTSETCWALNNEIIKQVTSSWSLFIQAVLNLLWIRDMHCLHFKNNKPVHLTTFRSRSKKVPRDLLTFLQQRCSSEETDMWIQKMKYKQGTTQTHTVNLFIFLYISVHPSQGQT